MINLSLLDKDNLILDMGLKVLSNTLEPLWETGHVAPENNNFFTFEEYAVNNRGDVFVLGRSFESEKVYEKHRKYKKVWKFPFGGYHRMEEYPDYSYKLLALAERGKSKKDFALSLPKYFVRKLTMKPDDNGNVICAGFFAGDNASSVIGNCTFKIDLNTDKMGVTNDKFSLEFMTEGREKREASKLRRKYKKNKEFETEFHFTKPLILKEDGGFYLLSEQVEQRRETQRSGNTITIYNAYNYNDILAISIDKNGETEWKRKVDKNTYVASENTIFSSFMVHPSNNDLYLVYEEIDKKSSNLFGVIKRSKATMVKINGDGSMQSEVISTAEENEVALLPKFAGHSGPNSFVMTGKNAARKFKFVNINF